MTKHTTYITAAHQEAFGEPAASIVTLHQDGDGFTLQPLFVRVTPGMTLADHDGLAPNPL